MFPEAKKMANAIHTVTLKLFEENIITDGSIAAIEPCRTALRAQKGLNHWEYSIPLDEPFRFTPLLDRDENVFTPEISIEAIKVETTASGVEFLKWNSALVLRYKDLDASPRWHWDLANSEQPGPQQHLQYGGRCNPERRNDEPLKVPRWNHPPLDFVLLAEAVAANFYHSKWISLREDPTWCRHVRVSERLCYLQHYSEMTNYLNTDYSTVLKQVWVGEEAKN